MKRMAQVPLQGYHGISQAIRLRLRLEVQVYYSYLSGLDYASLENLTQLSPTYTGISYFLNLVLGYPGISRPPPGSSFSRCWDSDSKPQNLNAASTCSYYYYYYLKLLREILFFDVGSISDLEPAAKSCPTCSSTGKLELSIPKIRESHDLLQILGGKPLLVCA